MQLEDKDVLNVPMLATDPYGKYLPGPHGLPQYVCNGNRDTDDGVDQGTGTTRLEGNVDQTRSRCPTTSSTSVRRS